MIVDNVELHNTAETVPGPNGGLLTLRVPERVRDNLETPARDRVRQPASAEIRFVSDDNCATITLAAPGGKLQVAPFFGRYRHGQPFTIGPEPATFQVKMPQQFTASLPALERMNDPFSSRVCRLLLMGEQPEVIAVEGNGVRPPSAGEVPALRYLSYGTSITHGAAASAPHLSYATQTARRIGADLLNFGVGGACRCEPAFADYIAERDDWHVATLALSVNMMGFTPEEFRERVEYVVNTVAGADTTRPVACITLFRYNGDRQIATRDNDMPEKPALFREILRQIVAACPHPNVTVFEGREMLADFAGLTTDLIHPSDDGMIQMGENIARRLLPLIGSARRV